ncbi:MAG TPA: ABC transporter substrate-binding protein, partial [Conexibacter sp.]|nr:ABC transporter substrate-binding protein [Conexibacter sp.]
MFSRGSIAVCAALALVAAGAGCGSDGDGTTVATSDGAAGAKPSGAPIVVGTTGPYTSDVIALPEARAAVEAAAKSINAAGGIDGRPLKIEACDDHLDPNQAAACGRKFADDDEMVATAGSVSIQGDHFEPAIEAAALADVGGYPVAAATLTSPVSFPLQGGTYIQYAGAATVIADRGFKRPVVIYHDIPTIKVVLQAIDTTLSASGLEVAGTVAISPTATDMSAAVAKARTYDPDVVLLAFPEPQISQAIQTEFQTGNRLPLITGAGDLSAEALKKLGLAADGVTS